MTQIQFLTPEQIDLIPEYQEKWRRLYLSTQPIDQIRAAAAIKGAYAVMKRPEPEVVFCASPRAALDILQAHVAKTNVPNVEPDLRPDGFPRDFNKMFLQTALGAIAVKKKQQVASIKPLHDLLPEVMKKPQKRIRKHVDKCLPREITAKDLFEQGFSDASWFSEIAWPGNSEETGRASDNFSAAAEDFPRQDWEQLESMLSWIPGKSFFLRWWLKNWIQGMLMTQVYGFSHPPFQALVCSALSAQENMFLQENPPVITSELAMMCMFIDFANSVLQYPVAAQKWSALQGLVKYCGWILAVDGLCVVCDRPTQIHINEKYQFHADTEPALQYSDGFALYAHHGRSIPEKYGSVPASEWQVQWILEESNPAWQQTLMKEFGAARLHQALPTIEIDAYQGYRLLRLEGVSPQNDLILTLVNPDAEEPYAVFVPPHVNSMQLTIQSAHHRYAESVFPRPNLETRETDS